MAGLTKSKIEDYVIDYFETQFPALAGQLDRNSNVKQICNYSDQAWADLATSVFNKFPWMIAAKILISQLELSVAPTIEKIVNLIWKKYTAKSTAKKKPRGAVRKWRGQ